MTKKFAVSLSRNLTNILGAFGVILGSAIVNPAQAEPNCNVLILVPPSGMTVSCADYDALLSSDIAADVREFEAVTFETAAPVTKGMTAAKPNPTPNPVVVPPYPGGNLLAGAPTPLPTPNQPNLRPPHPLATPCSGNDWPGSSGV